MKKYFILVFVCWGSTLLLQAQNCLPYKNAQLPVSTRVQDLLSRMTLEEKIGQLLCPMGWEMYTKKGETVKCSEKFKKAVQKKHIGMLWGLYRADPWTKKTLKTGLNPSLAAKTGNTLQRYMLEETRLGIPLFLAEEAPHGHMAIGTTVFPTGIGLASTWSIPLLKKVGNVIATEIRAQGAHIGYGPILDLAREPRWSRVEETFGEDPILTAHLGAAMVEGAGGKQLNQANRIISTLKHFIAYGLPLGGQNGNAAAVGTRELYQDYLPPFKSAIDAGALSIMTAYCSVDGIPCTSNAHLLKDVLLKEWGFKGFTISDLFSIEGLKESHFVTEDKQGAAELAITSGVNVDLGGEAYQHLLASVQQGRLQESVIDSAVGRVLRLKFEMGLFEQPYVEVQKTQKKVRSRAHIAVARETAQASIILLENKNQILPLNKRKRVAVIGPNANHVYNMLGDYTAPQDRTQIKTVLDGVLSKLPSSQVEYVKGCAIRDTLHTNIDEAVAAAERADVVVAVVGGSSARDFKTDYKATGAAVVTKDAINDMECGEGYDRATLTLMGKQLFLLKALKATHKPLVVIYIEGRPLLMNWAAEHADALLLGWYPGQEGGLGIADVIFGDYNPAGRLPISVPRSVGQLPVYYDLRNPKTHAYVEMTNEPLYSFGFGLSYTHFEYANLNIIAQTNHCFKVTFTVKNAGDYDGDEVVQLYLRDRIASVVQPRIQLKHFRRLFLKKGEEKEVSFLLTRQDLQLIDVALKPRVEPGEFSVLIGASSNDIRLEKKIRVEP